MRYWRDYLIAPGRQLGAFYIAPVVEASVWLDACASLCASMAVVRPLGFAVLTVKGGFWLPSYVGMQELASVQELEAATNLAMASGQAS